MIKKPLHMVENVGDSLFEVFHLVGLFVVGASILWASWAEVIHIIQAGGPKIKDVLLLFIYLELGAMVGIYFKTKRMPVRFLIYIAITALTRVLAIDAKTMENEHMFILTISILLLSLAVLVLKISSAKFSSAMHEEDKTGHLDSDV